MIDWVWGASGLSISGVLRQIGNDSTLALLR